MKKSRLSILVFLSIIICLSFVNRTKLINENFKQTFKKYILPYSEIDFLRKKWRESRKSKKVLDNFSPYTLDHDIALKNSLSTLELNNENSSVLNNLEIKIALYKPYKKIIMRGINNVLPGSAYLDKYNNHIFLTSSTGIIAYSNFDNEKLSFKQIKNNLNNYISEEDLRKSQTFSIKDLYIFKDDIYISYTNQVKENCWNLSIAKARINYKELIFEDFFAPNECINSRNNLDKVFNAHQSGGRIFKLDDNNLIFSTGEFRSRYLSQDINSIFGKIIKINTENQNFEIISMGHRNIQGLIFDSYNNLIISTEHGPRGGDEINVLDIKNLNNKTKPNYGWPVSSYGEHYSGKKRGLGWAPEDGNPYKKYPLKKSHRKFGFIEPVTYYTPSIGISELIDISVSKKLYLHTSLRDESLYLFKLDEKNNLIKNRRIYVGERIRDILRFENKIILFLEDTASIAVFEVDQINKIIEKEF